MLPTKTLEISGRRKPTTQIKWKQQRLNKQQGSAGCINHKSSTEEGHEGRLDVDLVHLLKVKSDL